MMGDATTARRALALLDLTDLSDTCSQAALDGLCHRAITAHGKVAAICIWPHFVGHAARRLSGTGVKVATVINFPRGGDNIDRAVGDTHEALRDGADEIDLVMPYRTFLQGDHKLPREMIEAVKDEMGTGKTLKVILETGAFSNDAAIASASKLALAAGADFIKTSTGKIDVSATLAAAKIMLEAIKASSKPAGFKAAGGVRTLADAASYLGLADTIMGPAWASPATFRFGASGLLDALLATLDGEVAMRGDGY